MNLTFFATLNAVIKGGSFAKAAADMHLSPSAVSLQMKRLEEHFGQLLFDRSAANVRPTPFAYQVMDVVDGALQGLEALRRKPTTLIAGDVRIGLIESMQALLLADAMRHLQQRHPALALNPLRDSSRALLRALKEGTIDMAVVALPSEARDRRLDWMPLLQEELVLLAPPGSVETSVSALLQSHPFIRFDKGSNLNKAVAGYLSRARLAPRAGFELQSSQAVVAMVSAGLGVSIQWRPDRRLTVGYPLREVSLGKLAPSLYITIVSRKPDRDSHVLNAVRDAFQHAVAIELLRRG